MRTLILSDGREFGTNHHTGGIFCRRRDGTWSQWAGTAQTPWFKDGLHMRRYLGRHYDGFQGLRIITRNF
jgi:hypothetical protein